MDTPINAKNITITPYHLIWALLNDNFDFDVNVANDDAKCALLGKVIQGSPCPEVRILTNGYDCNKMKLNDNSA